MCFVLTKIMIGTVVLHGIKGLVGSGGLFSCSLECVRLHCVTLMAFTDRQCLEEVGDRGDVSIRLFARNMKKKTHVV